MKSKLKYSALSVVLGGLIGASIGAGYIEHKSNESEKEHIEKMEVEESKLIYFEQRIGRINEDYFKREKQTHPFHVANWTFSLQKMPASQSRTDFSDSVIKATQDNIITDEEYLELKSEYEALELTNDVNVLKADLGKLVDGSQTNKEQ